MKVEFKLCGVDAVELGFARRVLFAVGCGGYRLVGVADVFAVHRRESMLEDYAFYRAEKKRTKESFLGNLTIDEGFYDCLDHNGNFMERSDVAYELVDNVKLLRVICRALFPDWNPTDSPYMGQGFSARHYLEQFIEKLRGFENNYVKFVDPQKVEQDDATGESH